MLCCSAIERNLQASAGSPGTTDRSFGRSYDLSHPVTGTARPQREEA
jgi:hypothetical protein